MKKEKVVNDQYYTKPEVAKQCFLLIKNEFKDIDLFIEPSAGNGSFYNLLPKNCRLGIDLDPKIENLLKQDFLEWETNLSKNICFVGNPPFGKNASLAIKFFNHSAKFGKYICFILPRTFRKDSTIKKLNKQFHLKKEIILEKESFNLADGTSYSVPCVFQLWEKKNYERINIEKSKIHEDWTWVKFKDNPDYAIRRVGYNAGKIFRFNKEISEASHYFIKCNLNTFNNFQEMFKSIYSTDDLKTHKFDTSGNPSLSMTEIVEDYMNFITNK